MRDRERGKGTSKEKLFPRGGGNTTIQKVSIFFGLESNPSGNFRIAKASSLQDLVSRIPSS